MPTVTTQRHDTAVLLAGLDCNLDAHFPELVVAHKDGIYSGVRRMVPAAGDAEEITQDTFVRAYRALRSYSSDRIADLALRPWLWTIALNLCRNVARSRARRPRTIPLDKTVEQADHQDAAEVAIAAVGETDWQRRLEGLSDPMRAAVVLRHVVGLPYAGIAAAVDRPVGTVKADVHRGIARLRDMLETETEVK